MNERRLTLYTRRGCPLCDEMAAALQSRLSGLQITVNTVDIDTDAELKARFGWDVPLLFAEDNEICRHVFNPVAFNAWLQGT